MKLKYLKSILFSFILIITSPVLLSGCVTTAYFTISAVSSNVPLKIQLADKHIQFKTWLALKDDHFDHEQVKVDVTVFNHLVLITGSVPSKQIKTAISQRIAHIPGVKTVYDRLIIAPHGNNASFVEDSLMTSRVKDALIQTKLNPFNYKIVTENHTVYILAMTDQKNGNIAARAASQVPGVKEVVKIYFDLR